MTPDAEDIEPILDYGTPCARDECDGTAYIFGIYEHVTVYKCKVCDYEWSET